jgi:hypothetical protein
LGYPPSEASEILVEGPKEGRVVRLARRPHAQLFPNADAEEGSRHIDVSVIVRLRPKDCLHAFGLSVLVGVVPCLGEGAVGVRCFVRWGSRRAIVELVSIGVYGAVPGGRPQLLMPALIVGGAKGGSRRAFVELVDIGVYGAIPGGRPQRLMPALIVGGAKGRDTPI